MAPLPRPSSVLSRHEGLLAPSSSAPSLLQLPARPVSRQGLRPSSRMLPPPPPPLPGHVQPLSNLLSQPLSRPPAPPRRRPKSVSFAPLPPPSPSSSSSQKPVAAANSMDDIELGAMHLRVVTDVSDWQDTILERSSSRSRRRETNGSGGRSRRRQQFTGTCCLRLDRESYSSAAARRSSPLRCGPDEAQCTVCRLVLPQAQLTADPPAPHALGSNSGAEGELKEDGSSAVVVRKAFGHLWVCTACVKDNDLFLGATRKEPLKGLAQLAAAPSSDAADLLITSGGAVNQAPSPELLHGTTDGTRAPVASGSAAKRCSSVPVGTRGGLLSQLGAFSLLPNWRPGKRSLLGTTRQLDSHASKQSAPAPLVGVAAAAIVAKPSKQEIPTNASFKDVLEGNAPDRVATRWRKPTPIWLEEALLLIGEDKGPAA